MNLVAMETLSQWLEKFHKPEHGLVYWHGFISAVGCTPQIIPPAEWIDELIDLLGPLSLFIPDENKLLQQAPGTTEEHLANMKNNIQNRYIIISRRYIQS